MKLSWCQTEPKHNTGIGSNGIVPCLGLVSVRCGPLRAHPMQTLVIAHKNDFCISVVEYRRYKDLHVKKNKTRSMLDFFFLAYEAG